MFSCGFATASGKSINVSEKALSEAKQFFVNEMDEVNFTKQIDATESKELLPCIPCHIPGQHSKDIKREATQSIKPLLFVEKKKDAKSIIHSTFTTANNKLINISEKSLLSAKQRFAEEFELQTEGTNIELQIKTGETSAKQETLFQETKLTRKESLKDINNAVLTLGFTTANGSSINVSHKALSKAKELFADEMNESGSNKQVSIANDNSKTYEMQTRNIGFQTASGQNVKISKEALSKAKALFSEENLSDTESNDIKAQSFQKRKLIDIDDSNVHKCDMPSQFKKLRFSNEVQAKGASCKNLTNNIENIVSSELNKIPVSNCSYNNFTDYSSITTKKNENTERNLNSPISKEIVDSTIALLTDEKISSTFEQHNSCVEMKDKGDVVDVPSSPVIGCQFIPRKRKTKRKKIVHSLNNTELVPMQTATKQSNVNVECSMNKEVGEFQKEKRKKDEQISSDLTIANAFGDTQLMLDFIDHSANILHKRLEAALEQEKQICLKKRVKPKPISSKLFLYKNSNVNNRISWRNISKGAVPFLYTRKELIDKKLPPEIFDITAETAMAYKFRCTDFYGPDVVQSNSDGIQTENGGCLILDENGYLGITEIKRSFLASPGVDPNLLSPGWVENHYRWIVWKLASMDRVKLGSIDLPRALTPATVMAQLKLRYDREIDRSQRSALRKILEKDDVPSKRMVLCVSCIIEDNKSVKKNPEMLETSQKKLMLTDGWYSISASIDHAMIKNILSGKVKEGTKLLTYGAELLNCDQGCSPLEVPDGVCLKLHTNSTRRARWDTKMGYMAPPGPLRVKLKSISPNGGLIGKIQVYVSRVYPTLYHEKTSTGESVFRNSRSEEKANIAYEQECRSKIEAFYVKAEKYYYATKKPGSMQTDSIDLAAVEWNEGREKLSKHEFLTKQEHEQLLHQYRIKEEEFMRKLESRLHENVPPPRQVTPLLKIRIIEDETTAILSVWSPNEEVTDILKEGNCISICNVTTSGKRSGELQLTAGRNTLFDLKNACNIFHPPRMYTPLHDIIQLTFSPAYGEFDTVGTVVTIGNEPYGMKNFEAVYLAYPNANSQSSYLSILFWNGITSYGYAEILTVGSCIACSNLEWRRATSWNIPMAYCTERSIFTRNPRQHHFQQPFADLKNLITDTAAYVATCKAEIATEVQKKSVPRTGDYKTPDKNEIPTSDKQYSGCTPQELSLLNFPNNNQGIKSTTIRKRLEKLQCYGEPLRMSPIVLKNSSKRVSLNFKSPVRSKNTDPTKDHRELSTNSPNSR